MPPVEACDLVGFLERGAFWGPWRARNLAALASSISGKNVRYQPVEDREYREHVTALGVPEAAIGMLLDYYAAVRSGWASSPTSDLAQLLHRAPVSTIEAIRQAAAA
jgi:hypothetical protein